MKSKKFTGYVPKTEKIGQTLHLSVGDDGETKKNFGMDSKKELGKVGSGIFVKRTITITWEDKPVKK